ncbi:tubulin epsilon and delta complex protein 1 [Gastrophryne carolinensis]
MKKVGSLKEALCALCRLLSLCGSHCEPETIRRAKFNRPEATTELWKLLYCVLKKISLESDISSASENGSLGNQIRCVKSILQAQGYGRSALYELPDDGSEGSRELLLAFSWYLYTGKLLEIMLEKNRLQFGDHITICMCPQGMDFRAIKDCASFPDPNIDVRYLQWLNGKLRYRWRHVHAAHQEKCKILHKIHLYTNGCHVDQRIQHLSALETELIRCPEMCGRLLQSLEVENCCLEAYLEWRRTKSVYWQWMESVLESAVEDERISSSKNKIKIYTSFPSGFKPHSNLGYVKELHKSFCDVHDRFNEQLSHMFRLQEQISELSATSSERETLLTKKKIKQEVRRKAEHLQDHNEHASNIHGSFRVIFRESKMQGAVHKDFHLKTIHATDMIATLQTAARQLEAEYQHLQDKSRKKLDEIAEKLEGIVCIPPAKC